MSALLVPVDRHVGDAGGEVRRVDVADGAEGRQAGEVRGHVGPGLAAVPGQLDLASFVPAQMRPGASGLSAIANTTGAIVGPASSRVRPPVRRISAGSAVVRSGEMRCQLWPRSRLRWTYWLPA